MRNVLLFFLLSQSLFAQELVQNDFEKGYLKDGAKVGIWEYYNERKEKELVINHTTKEVSFQKRDTLKYSILKEGEWVKTTLDAVPLPTEGSYNLKNTLKEKIRFPLQDVSKNISGKVVVTFEVDTLGKVDNFEVVQGLDHYCDSAALKGLSEVNWLWMPAVLGGKKYPSKFALGIDFRADSMSLNYKTKWVIENGKKILKTVPTNIPTDSKFLFWIITFPREGEGKSSIEAPYLRAEFPGGPKKMQEYINDKFYYPYAARRFGMQGKLFVNFIVETDGSITNVKILNDKIDAKFYKSQREAAEMVYREVRKLFEKMPKWIPARKKNGEKTKHSVTMPFELILR
ncbi:MAG: energy transducer TonB [Cyclobacteriaceae bacterium]